MNNLRQVSRPLQQALKGLSTTRMFHAAAALSTGKTLEATSETFASLVNNADHPVIVDFYADWCGPCKMLGPILSRTVAENPKVTLVKINVDDAQDIAAKYQIAALPTVSAFHEGKIVDQFVGMRAPPQVSEFVKKHAELA